MSTNNANCLYYIKTLVNTKYKFSNYIQLRVRIPRNSVYNLVQVGELYKKNKDGDLSVLFKTPAISHRRAAYSYFIVVDNDF